MNEAAAGPKNAADLLLAMIQALRIKQWIKNLLLYAALIFALKFTELGMVMDATLGFITFCMVSSAGYIYNDSRDREADAKHPRKCKRPIASGRLPLGVAYAEMVGLLVVGFGVAYSLSPVFALVTLLYLATTLSYTFFFKHHVILDVMFISAGFLWRAAAGAIAIDVLISPWLLTCTAFLTLFIGFNKRRSELGLMAGKGNATRKNLMHYTPELLVEFQAITTSGTVISYALYTVLGSPSQWLLLTLPYVLYGIFRYIFLVNNLDEGEEPADTLLRDLPLLATVVLYGITVVGILLVTRVGV
ncbi:MAG: decaprenyl-phosphate phosphoribosyltransferase [Myxococcota bacterium]|nr:decaprenyl-phosphate phosphoribosyltransferase [Myxococcota bacterium]